MQTARRTTSSTNDHLNISAVGARFDSTKLAAGVSAIRGALALTLAVFFALPLIAARPAQAQEKVLYSFGSQPGDGTSPEAALVFGKKGDLYGTTYLGGADECGTVFELTAAGTEKVLYSFESQPLDGCTPLAGLVFDKNGNLYGTTAFGVEPTGTVFGLTAAGTETVLYRFLSQPGDGYYPLAGLVFDKNGNLYGTTSDGGAHSAGTVFELTAAGTEIVLYSFGSQPGDGANPYAGLVFDKKGNLYGTTVAGGADGHGTVFELTAAGAETVLYSFGSQPGDGLNPRAGLVFDKKGNLYGTAEAGGADGYGTLFELTAAGAEKVLYSFGSQPGDGEYPFAGLVFDKQGNLYGTTADGGAHDYGTVFELTAADTETVLYSFGSQPGDGHYPEAGLVFDKKGNLYGTTIAGGADDYGTVFEVIP
jgi:uncharacterized repeat protein (TIGR03803 family)